MVRTSSRRRRTLLPTKIPDDNIVVAPEAAPSRRKRKVALVKEKPSPNSVVVTPPPIFSSFELQGHRDYMEDRVLAAAPMGPGSSRHFFGVYDGHGGDEASQYCKEHMVEAVLHDEGLFAKDVPNALRGAYARIDEEFCEIANASEGENKIESGTTAVSVVLGPKEFYIANTGDSRAVLVRRDGSAKAVTVDHDPSKKSEGARIRRAGGMVENDEGCFRVEGVLGVSRAIGDAYLKKYVISDPDVKRHVRNTKQAFLVLGSDGLWDDVTPDDCAMVLGLQDGGKQPTTEKQLHSCAKKMVKMAFKNGSQDNICCIIIDLRDYAPATKARKKAAPTEAAEAEEAAPKKGRAKKTAGGARKKKR